MASESDVLIIDNELRTITVPKGFILGVYHDKDTHKVSFKGPKSYGSIDLSGYTVRVNYKNALGEGYQYTADDLAVSDDNLTFSWLVGEDAYRGAGTVSFIVCFVKLDDDGYITNEFNTTLASATVLPGYEGVVELSATTNTIIPGSTPDIILSVDSSLLSKTTKARFDFTQNSRVVLSVDATITSTKIHHVFTQSETYSFDEGTVKCQVHGLTSDGVAWKTKVFVITIEESLNSEVIS